MSDPFPFATLPPLEELEPAPVIPRQGWKPVVHRTQPRGPLAESDVEAAFFGDGDPDVGRAEAAASRSSTLAKTAGLRPFPMVARRALAVLDDPAYRLEELERVVAGDPALASKVLRIANSAAMGGRVAVTSLRAAMVRLGSRALRGLVVSVVALDGLKEASPLARQVRDHCGAVGAITRVLGVRLGMGDRSELLLAGLLHDLGKLLLVQSGELDYRDLRGVDLTKADRVHHAERSRLGFDHAVLGAHVLRQWRLPDPLPDAVGLHHDPARAYAQGGDVARLVAVLRVADQLEYAIRDVPEPIPAVVERLAAGSDCARAGLDATDLDELWMPAREARQEILTIFG